MDSIFTAFNDALTTIVEYLTESYGWPTAAMIIFAAVVFILFYALRSGLLLMFAVVVLLIAVFAEPAWDIFLSWLPLDSIPDITVPTVPETETTVPPTTTPLETVPETSTP